MRMLIPELPAPRVRAALSAADASLRAQHAAGIFDDGDPNHPRHNNGINYATGRPLILFGELTAQFLLRQYRPA